MKTGTLDEAIQKLIEQFKNKLNKWKFIKD